jgi:superfamily II DNA or RNA helicase
MEELFAPPFVEDRGPEPTPRPYQDAAAAAAVETLGEVDSAIVLCATGCLVGDTVVGFNTNSKSFTTTMRQAYVHYHGGDPDVQVGYCACGCGERTTVPRVSDASSGRVSGVPLRFVRYHESRARRWNGRIAVRAYRGERGFGLQPVLDIVRSGVKEVYRLVLANGMTVSGTADHLIMTADGWVPLGQLTTGTAVATDRRTPVKTGQRKAKLRDYHFVNLWKHPYGRRVRTDRTSRGYTIRVPKHVAVWEAHANGLSLDDYISVMRGGDPAGLIVVDPTTHVVHHKDGDHGNNTVNNLELMTTLKHCVFHGKKHGFRNFGNSEPVLSEVVSVERIGDEMTYDICCERPYHNFVANGIVVHNSGKTLVGSRVIRDWPRDRRCLVLVNRDELKAQWASMLRAVCRDDVVEIEDAERQSRHFGMSMFNDDVGRIVVASKDSLYRWRRLRRWRPDEVGLLLIDEAHRCVPTNKTYTRILNHFKGYKLLGTTATLDRMDGVAAGCYFKRVAYSYDAYTAIRDGYLPEIRQQMETVKGWDLTRIKRNALGEFDKSHLDATMREEKPLQAIATAAFKYGFQGGRRRPTLIFCVSVDHSEICADVLTRQRPGCAEWLSGEDDMERRREVIARFRRGEFQFLCGCTLFTEGFDEPTIEVIVIGRPTLSRILYAQMIGRGLRLHPSVVDAVNAAADADARREIIRTSLKPSVTVVDMVGCSARHKLRTCTTVDVLGGNFPPEVREKAADMMGDARPGGDAKGKNPVEILKAARGRLHEEERARRREIVMVAKLRSKPVDPFDFLDVKPPRRTTLNRGRLATPKMIQYLVSHEVPIPKRLRFDDAATLIEALKDRIDKGPPSEKMLAVLARENVPTDTMTYGEARAAMSFLAEIRGWKR